MTTLRFGTITGQLVSGGTLDSEALKQLCEDIGRQHKRNIHYSFSKAGESGTFMPATNQLEAVPTRDTFEIRASVDPIGLQQDAGTEMALLNAIKQQYPNQTLGLRMTRPSVEVIA